MRSKRLLIDLLDYLELFEEAFPSEQELSLQSLRQQSPTRPTDTTEHSYSLIS